MATLSKGITLSYKKNGGADFEELSNLLEIPELGGETEAVEITTLEDSAHVYMNGIMNYGDSLAFKFIYENEQFDDLRSLASGGIAQDWKVALPDGASCTFSGACSIKLDGVGVNAALTYTLSIKPSSAMTWAMA